MVRVQQKARGRTTGSANNRPSLRNGFYGLYVLSPGTGLIAPVVHGLVEEDRELDTSTGMPGPHDFTVRENCARRNATPRPPHAALNVRDDAYAPHRAGMRGGKHELRKKRSSIFSARRLDHPNQFGLAREIRFLARAVSVRSSCAQGELDAKPQDDASDLADGSAPLCRHLSEPDPR
jgi:hypothetical protein